METNSLLTVIEAAAYLGVGKQWLYQLRCQGGGPDYVRRQTSGLGRGPSIRLFYRVSALDEWNSKRAKKPKKQKSKTKKASAVTRSKAKAA